MIEIEILRLKNKAFTETKWLKNKGTGNMDDSERIQRMKENRYFEGYESRKMDQEFCDRIAALLNHSKIDEHCMVDAYYYDFSVIPRDVKDRLNLWRDCYLIFGITTEGEIVSKWVDRWDLDSEDPIVDGKVIHSDKPRDPIFIPQINQHYNPELLSTPAPEFLRMSGGEAISPVDNMVDMSNMELCETCKSQVLAAFMKACGGCHE